jgi:hypothetical protein
MRKSLSVLVPVLLRIAASAQVADAQPHKSLRFSCIDKAFLSVSVSAPRHDHFPNLDLGLVDPAGRTAGMGHDDRSIPNSQYGMVIEIPSHPDMSKAVAIEICDAGPGAYLVSVLESGEKDYRLSVSADDGSGSNKGNDSEEVNIRAEGDRVCHYRFKLQLQNGHVAIRWLDKAGHPLSFAERPICDGVPRT